MNTCPNTDEKTLAIRVPGDLISTRAEEMRAEVARALDAQRDGASPWNVLRLDLTSAKMVDSVGLNLIVVLLKAAQKVGARMVIDYASPNVYRTLVFTRLDKHVELVKAG